jgi:hypothetical protein
MNYRCEEVLTDNLLVTNSRRCREKETPPESNVWILTPIRRILPRRLDENGLRPHRPPIHLPLPNMRHARPLRLLRNIR